MPFFVVSSCATTLRNGPTSWPGKAASNIDPTRRMERTCTVLGLPTPMPRYLGSLRLPQLANLVDEGTKIGETFAAFFLQCPADKAVDSWYSEIQKYQFGREPTSTGTGN